VRQVLLLEVVCPAQEVQEKLRYLDSQRCGKRYHRVDPIAMGRFATFSFTKPDGVLNILRTDVSERSSTGCGREVKWDRMTPVKFAPARKPVTHFQVGSEHHGHLDSTSNKWNCPDDDVHVHLDSQIGEPVFMATVECDPVEIRSESWFQATIGQAVAGVGRVITNLGGKWFGSKEHDDHALTEQDNHVSRDVAASGVCPLSGDPMDVEDSEFKPGCAQQLPFPVDAAHTRSVQTTS